MSNALKILLFLILFFFAYFGLVLLIGQPFDLRLWIFGGALLFLAFLGVLLYFAVTTLTRNWGRLEPVWPLLGVGLSMCGIVYVIALLTGTITYLPQKCSRSKDGVICHMLNALYSIGGPWILAAFVSVASLAVFWWSWKALREKFGRQTPSS
jgi:hypothetical protein